jgi:hypothetical protein
MTITIPTHGHTFGIELEGGLVTITQDGVYAGSGLWNGEAIEHCDAVLGDMSNAVPDEVIDPGQSDAIYDALDDAIYAAIEGRS